MGKKLPKSAHGGLNLSLAEARGWIVWARIASKCNALIARSTITKPELLYTKKHISPRMNTDNTDLQIQSGPIFNFFDQCKSVSSVSSVVRFGLLRKASQNVKLAGFVLLHPDLIHRKAIDHRPIAGKPKSRYSPAMAKEFMCMVCDQPERSCSCNKYCALCQSLYEVRLCEDGIYYCRPCREACDLQAQVGGKNSSW